MNMFYSQRVVTVFCQFIFPSNFFVTIAAVIRFIPSIHYLISNQITIMCKLFSTMVALIWFLLSVYFQVSYPKTILTKIKSQWLHQYSFSSLCILWCSPKLPFLIKTIIIMAAFLWFISSVYSHVIYKIILIYLSQQLQ